MVKPKIVTITDPVELLKAQIAEIHKGNAATRAEIQRLQDLLTEAKYEEQRLRSELEEWLSMPKYRESNHGT